MLRGTLVLKPMHIYTIMSMISFKILRNLKASKGGFKKEKKMTPNDCVHCCVIGCHGDSLLHLVLTKKSVVSDF